jgi:DNA polymerase-3 subunit chi
VTQIDFYILNDQAKGDRFLLACRLTEKAYLAGHRVCINTGSEADAGRIDELLWTYKEQSFIPHESVNSQVDLSTAPVQIACQINQTEEHDVLINLASEVPACFSQFERLLEPVDQMETNKVSGRSRYRYYRDCGYSITNHEINR